MKQLPQDWYAKNYVPPTPIPVEPVLSPILPLNPPVDDTIPSYPSQGGAWYGSSPPSDPQIGWMWLNPANNGLYLYTDPGVWTQIGTNW
jgi:hypothetical protein